MRISQLDKHILNELAEVEDNVMQDFEELYFARGEFSHHFRIAYIYRRMLTGHVLSLALQNINTFVSGSLSTLYVEETKDVLYCDPADSDRRQAVVAVLGHVSPEPGNLQPICSTLICCHT